VTTARGRRTVDAVPALADTTTAASDDTESAVAGDDGILPDLVDAGNVADAFVRVLRMNSRLKAQALADAKRSLEWSAVTLINCLATDGPMRSSALAEAVQSDPSTVSRQVATLVADGLVERGVDPLDGRASLLAITERGLLVHQENKRARNQFYQLVLRGWDEDELRVFAAQLARFAKSFERNRPEWAREGTVPRIPPQQEGNR
jgi:DNA-binding MarR family transcriptional regulator